jgi:hypothetical protein
MKNLKMPKKHEKALDKSIEFWKKRKDNSDLDFECPLCLLFTHREDVQDCVGCPVMRVTGVDDCEETPYWNRMRFEWKNYCQAEIDFLETCYY